VNVYQRNSFLLQCGKTTEKWNLNSSVLLQVMFKVTANACFLMTSSLFRLQCVCWQYDWCMTNRKWFWMETSWCNPTLHFPRGTETKHRKLESWEMVSHPRLKPQSFMVEIS
jgi:hypothetical protein